MGKLSPVSHRVLIERLRNLGFEGPYAGGRHSFMVRGSLRLTIPSIHSEDIGVPLLTRILQQAGISRDDWDNSR